MFSISPFILCAVTTDLAFCKFLSGQWNRWFTADWDRRSQTLFWISKKMLEYQSKHLSQIAIGALLNGIEKIAVAQTTSLIFGMWPSLSQKSCLRRARRQAVRRSVCGVEKSRDASTGAQHPPNLVLVISSWPSGTHFFGMLQMFMMIIQIPSIVNVIMVNLNLGIGSNVVSIRIDSTFIIIIYT